MPVLVLQFAEPDGVRPVLDLRYNLIGELDGVIGWSMSLDRELQQKIGNIWPALIRQQVEFPDDSSDLGDVLLLQSVTALVATDLDVEEFHVGLDVVLLRHEDVILPVDNIPSKTLILAIAGRAKVEGVHEGVEHLLVEPPGPGPYHVIDMPGQQALKLTTRTVPVEHGGVSSEPLAAQLDESSGKCLVPLERGIPKPVHGLEEPPNDPRLGVGLGRLDVVLSNLRAKVGKTMTFVKVMVLSNLRAKVLKL